MMHKGSRHLLLTLLILALVEVILLIVMRPPRSTDLTIRTRCQAVALTGLPDLALGHQATWIRHRTLAAPFAVFPEDGALLDYFPGSFVYQLALPEVERHRHEP